MSPLGVDGISSLEPNWFLVDLMERQDKVDIDEKGDPKPELRTPIQIQQKVDQLERAKKMAAEKEDYDLAKQLKGELEVLKSTGVLKSSYMCPRHAHQELAFFDFTAHEPICRDCKDPLMGGHVTHDHAVKRIDEAASDLRTATHGLRAGVNALFAFSETAMLEVISDYYYIRTYVL